jgi:hypothetical protein
MRSGQRRPAAHNMTGTPEYEAWRGMRNRCELPTTGGYEQYGGRGIVVCERWRESFANFYADMGPRPTSAHSLDRIYVNGSYEPSNCRWATPKEQARNRRGTRLITHMGVTKPIGDLADESHMRADVLAKRLDMGWSIERAITQPVQPRKNARRQL